MLQTVMTVLDTEFEQETTLPSSRLLNQEHDSNKNKGVIYMWKNLTVTTRLKKKKCFSFYNLKKNPIVEKKLVNDVSGFSLPGELLAILGASGAGKTTLLNALNMQNLARLNVKGECKINGHFISSKKLTSISAYVQQENIFIGTLTVREHLVFQAKVRMNASFSMESKLARVEELIKEFGLVKCADVLIGIKNRINGISGGEAKRLAFASEILTYPSIMFCDEPTTGLDSYMAQNIIEILRDKAHQGNTIICTIHQPSSQVFELFDKILLLAEGRLAFLGAPNEAQTFFKNCGFDLPLHYNPADFYIQKLAIVHNLEAECKERVTFICNKFQTSKFGKSIIKKLELYANYNSLPSNLTNLDLIKTFSSSPYRVSWFLQFCAVIQRTFLTTIKEPKVFKVNFLFAIVFSLIMGSVFFGQNLDQEGIMNINGAMFLIIVGQTYDICFELLATFCTLTPLFLREHRNGLYRVDIYFITKQIIDCPIYLTSTLIKITITYWMVGMNSDPWRFLTALGIHLVLVQTTTSFAYMISCLAPSYQIANSITTMIIHPFLLLGGFILNTISIPFYLVWIKYLSWFNYSYQALCINQWKGVQNIRCNRPLNTTANLACINTGDQVLAMLNFDPNDLLFNIALLLVLAIGFRFIAFAGLLFRARYRK